MSYISFGGDKRAHVRMVVHGNTSIIHATSLVDTAVAPKGVGEHSQHVLRYRADTKSTLGVDGIRRGRLSDPRDDQHVRWDTHTHMLTQLANDPLLLMTAFNQPGSLVVELSPGYYNLLVSLEYYRNI